MMYQSCYNLGPAEGRIAFRQGAMRKELAAIRPTRMDTAAAVTPTIPNFHPKSGKSRAIPVTSRAVAMVMGRVFLAPTRMLRWKDRSADRKGSGTRIIVGRIAKRAKSGLKPETDTNQRVDRGVRATRARTDVLEMARTAANRASGRKCSKSLPMRAMPTSWNERPMDRNRKTKDDTTGNTANDSTGAVALPMKKVIMGWAARAIMEVSARG